MTSKWHYLLPNGTHFPENDLTFGDLKETALDYGLRTPN